MGSIAPKYFHRLLLLGSLLTSVLVGALLMAWHAPLAGPRLSAGKHPLAIASSSSDLSFPDSGSSHKLIHFLSPRCKCSERLAAYLVGRAPRADVSESVVLLGDDNPLEAPGEALQRLLAQLRRRGYNVLPNPAESASPTATSQDESAAHSQPGNLSIPGGPWLVIEDRRGQVEYSGGYEVAPYWEARILYAVQNRHIQASLPATGCAASTKLRANNLALRWKDLVNSL